MVPPGAAEAFLAAVRRPGAAGDAPDVPAAQLEAVTLQPSTPPKQERQPKSAGVSPGTPCEHRFNNVDALSSIL